LIGEAHGHGAAHGVADEDSSAESDFVVPSQSVDGFNGTTLDAGEREGIGAVAVAGEVHKKYSKASRDKLLSECEHQATIRCDSVKNEGGAFDVAGRGSENSERHSASWGIEEAVFDRTAIGVDHPGANDDCRDTDGSEKRASGGHRCNQKRIGRA
jgi:hypothetical protein